jgi:hypothetical protein
LKKRTDVNLQMTTNHYTKLALGQLSPSFSQLSHMSPQLSPYQTQTSPNSDLLENRIGGVSGLRVLGGVECRM